MNDQEKRQKCEKILKQKRHMKKWGIDDPKQVAALIAQFEDFLAQPRIPDTFDVLYSYINDHRKVYARERARRQRVGFVSLNPDFLADPRSLREDDPAPGRSKVDALLARSVDSYGTEGQKKAYLEFRRTGCVSSHGMAKRLGVSRERSRQLTEAAGYRALAGAFLIAAEQQSPEAADLVLSTQFALRGPFAANVLIAYDTIVNSQKNEPDYLSWRAKIDKGLPSLWEKATTRLFHILEHPDNAGTDVCQVQPAFMAMFIAARWGGKDYWPLCRDAFAEAQRRGLAGHPVLARHLATIGAYCDEPGRQLAFLGSEQGHLVERTTTWLFFHGGIKSGLPHPHIVRGRLDTTRELLRNTKRYFPKPALDYTLRCLNNTRYRNDGLTGTVLTWADMLVSDLDAATAQPLGKQLTKLANTLEHNRSAICQTRGLTTVYTGVVDRLHWLRRELAKNFLAQG